jgi:hypothetical protein
VHPCGSLNRSEVNQQDKSPGCIIFLSNENKKNKENKEAKTGKK